MKLFSVLRASFVKVLLHMESPLIISLIPRVKWFSCDSSSLCRGRKAQNHQFVQSHVVMRWQSQNWKPDALISNKALGIVPSLVVS